MPENEPEIRANALRFRITNQFLKLLTPKAIMVSDTIRYIEMYFKFSSDWNGLTKVVHFQSSSNATTYDFILQHGDYIDETDNLQLGAGGWRIWLHGDEIVDGVTYQRIVSSKSFFVIKQSGVIDGEPLPITPPSLGEQILAMATQAEEDAADALEGVEAIRTEIEEGTLGFSYTYTQGVPSMIWVIPHNLGRWPSVTVVDSGGSTVIGSVKYDSDVQVTITFSKPFSGKAFLN